MPTIAPNNGQINEHCRGPIVPVICVPNKNPNSSLISILILYLVQ